MGSPTINRDSAWTVYCDLVKYVYADYESQNMRIDWENELEAEEAVDDIRPDPEVEKLRPLVDIGDRSDGSFYLGGVNGGAGLGEYGHRSERSIDLP